ncbi:hypothetical protein [Micromonospora sp. NPDC004704]
MAKEKPTEPAKGNGERVEIKTKTSRVVVERNDGQVAGNWTGGMHQ